MGKPQNILHLFQGYGVELEYMLVHADTLKVAPIADKLLFSEAGTYVSDVEFKNIAWSNELVLHVIELKTNGPANSLHQLHHRFQEHVQRANSNLATYNAMLLPTGAHPLMDPYTETRLWPHEHNTIYETYNRVFNCKGHGWANLQSTHLNLPFNGDAEFGKLHAAIRMVLPLIPAISASSPILDGKITGYQDTRLQVYRHNQDKVPQVAGKIIPEAVFNQRDYQCKILTPSYQAIAPFDPEGILQHEFLNSRGAIARFSRNAIEIRLLDIQECPLADIAVLQLLVAVIKALVSERWASINQLQHWHEDKLAPMLWHVTKHGQETELTDAAFTKCFGFTGTCTAGELWKHLVNQLPELNNEPEARKALDIILANGNLSKRILAAVGEQPSETTIRSVYLQLATCLQNGHMFIPAPTC